jgi:hypothetical protein
MVAVIEGYSPGERITHSEFGQGVILDTERDGYLRAFFGVGERRVPVNSIRRELSRTERILRAVAGGDDRARKAWLCYEAHALPIMESASALTSAKIDLLPHQVVLTHRIATASPRRYLVADEVGLGKTIETALILRELASRGELTRALMVVPAGLVNNWHRELNEVFNLRGGHHRPEDQRFRQARPGNCQHRHPQASGSNQALARRTTLGSSGIRRGASSYRLPCGRKNQED